MSSNAEPANTGDGEHAVPPGLESCRAAETETAAGAEATRKVADPRMHTAEHILTATLMAMFGCGRPFTTHLEKKKSKADYRLARELTLEEVQEVERRVNALVAANLPVREEFLPRAEAEKRHDLGRLPAEAGDRIRIVHVGDYDACPCSGNHVSSTGQIGAFRIVSTTWEAGALRVRFKLGAGAEST